MDYKDTYPGSTRPLKAQRADSAAVNISAKEIVHRTPAESKSANIQERVKLEKEAAADQAHGPLAVEIRHPLAAIAANANAATRWLKRPDANLAEALAALDRIVKDCIRIDTMSTASTG